MLDDIAIEKAARATWLIEHREPGGRPRPASAWRDLAPAIKEAEREKVRSASRMLRQALSLLRSSDRGSVGTEEE